MKRIIITTLLAAILPLAMYAQSNWGLITNIGIDKQITKGFHIGAEALYYQTDNFKNTDRWGLGVSVEKRLYRNFLKTFDIKASAGYRFMNVYNGWSTKYKGADPAIKDKLAPQYYIDGQHNFNHNHPYSDFRHRVTASIQASYKKYRFNISLREKYQFTHTNSADYNKDKYRFKYDEDRESKILTSSTVQDTKAAKNKSVLRSRIKLNYDIAGYPIKPFISYELSNTLDKDFTLDKTTFCAGLKFSILKKHDVELSYQHQDKTDTIEPIEAYLCVGYTYSF